MMNKQQLITALQLQTISAGILSSNWLDLRTTLEILQNNNVHLLHFDIADGHFCPMFTFGSQVIKQFPETFIKDVHLMVTHQFDVAKTCVENGANIITLQAESNENLAEIYDWIGLQNENILCGLSLCPSTELSIIEKYIDQLDLIQILSLDPRTGEKMTADNLMTRLKELKRILNGQHKLISVDGSMNLALAKSIYPFGINWVVSGSALFSQENLELTLKEWKNI